MTNGFLPSRSRSSLSLCAGEGIAPKMAISTAPPHTSMVPHSDHRVKGSPSIRVAHIELKTRPDAWRVERTGSGSIEIWIELPRTFAMMNMPIPSCHLLLLYGGRRASYGPFSSSRICDFLCSVRPRLWTLVDMSPTTIPIWSKKVGVSIGPGMGACLSQLTAMLPPGERPSMSPIAQRTVGHVPDAVDVGGLLLRSHRNRRVFGIEETCLVGVVSLLGFGGADGRGWMRYRGGRERWVWGSRRVEKRAVL